MRPTTALPLLLSAGLAIGACGGGEASGGTGTDRADRNRDAALKFARCMRENGVDMPDPAVREGGGIIVGGGPGAGAGDQPSPGTLRRAHEACREHLEGLRPPEMSEQERQEFRERALAHARCMREQGLDFPDPQFGEGGTLRMEAGGREGDGSNPNSRRFREAMEHCRGKLGGGPVVEAAPGGGGS